jgi:hypothetical protein
LALAVSALLPIPFADPLIQAISAAPFVAAHCLKKHLPVFDTETRKDAEKLIWNLIIPYFCRMSSIFIKNAIRLNQLSSPQ